MRGCCRSSWMGTGNPSPSPKRQWRPPYENLLRWLTSSSNTLTSTSVLRTGCRAPAKPCWTCTSSRCSVRSLSMSSICGRPPTGFEAWRKRQEHQNHPQQLRSDLLFRGASCPGEAPSRQSVQGTGSAVGGAGGGRCQILDSCGASAASTLPICTKTSRNSWS